MLRRLSIEDFGLIERAQIDLAADLTIFTGETGSGKTMVLGAIAFVLGERAAADMVRRGAKRALVTLTFEPSAALRQRLEDDGAGIDPDEDAVLVREMTDAGKSSLRLNGRATTAGYVREIAGGIADLIGQHEAQRLLAPQYHGEILDAFGGAGVVAALARVREAHAAHARAEAALASLRELESKAQAEFEFAQYALDEIRGAAPEAGEDTRLNERRRYLENIERISSALQTAHEALAGEDGASDALGRAAVAFSGIQSISAGLDEMSDAAHALQDEATDLAVRLSRELDRTEFDAAELESINARLDVLERLGKKYGGTLDAVLESQRRYAELVETYATRGERRTALEAALGAAERSLQSNAAKLTALREKTALRMKAAVESEFPDLALPAAAFSAKLIPLSPVSADGAESVEFQFSANAGEPERALAKVASGGELSRVLLALIVAVMDSRSPVALIFDEIDAGIGGATANAVASRLSRLGKTTQVIVVTHLAQIASFAERHFILEKDEKAGVTLISAREASERSERAQELARMLSGEQAGVALEHAEELLKAAAG